MHKGSATKLGTKIKEALAKAGEVYQTDKNALKQMKDTLVEKIESLRALDNGIIKLLSNSQSEDAHQQLDKEMEEIDDTRAELEG